MKWGNIVKENTIVYDMSLFVIEDTKKKNHDVKRGNVSGGILRIVF